MPAIPDTDRLADGLRLVIDGETFHVARSGTGPAEASQPNGAAFQWRGCATSECTVKLSGDESASLARLMQAAGVAVNPLPHPQVSTRWRASAGRCVFRGYFSDYVRESGTAIVSGELVVTPYPCEAVCAPEVLADE